ncbi:MAG: hypothetical protein LBD31_01510 [Treponema sp.]|nr:hypothetical protein [Treponema sp.]
MKRVLVFFTGCALALSGCASGPARVETANDGRAVQGGMPPFIQDAVKNAPPDTLAGVGVAKIGAAGARVKITGYVGIHHTPELAGTIPRHLWRGSSLDLFARPG